MSRLFASVPFGLMLVFSASCSPSPPELEGLFPGAASFACSDDGESGEPVWLFEVGIEGPVDEGQTSAGISSVDLPEEQSLPLTVEGSNELATTFRGEIAGTPAGQAPAPGALAFSCEDVDVVEVTFCASPEGRPNERPCWGCDDGSGESLPPDIEAWISCD